MVRWLLLDGFNLAFRAFYGLPELTRSDGFPTGALHGWVRTLWYLEDTWEPDHMVVFFDSGGDTEREALLGQYKAQRAPCPPALEQQIPLIKQITAAAGIPAVEQRGVEADDLLAALAVDRVAAGDEAYMVSADKDLGQVVRPGLRQLVPPPTANPKLGWRELDEVGVHEKFGVAPTQIPAYLALIGDTVDNIPGIEGVGPKTAANWLNLYGSLDGIFDHSGELKPKRFQTVVHEARERLRLNLRLTTLRLDRVPPVPAAPGPAAEALAALLESMEMRTSARDARKRYAAP